MKDVCTDCRYSKPRSEDYCYCVKYGCNIHYGRIYCISWERDEHEQVRSGKGTSGRDGVRQ